MGTRAVSPQPAPGQGTQSSRPSSAGNAITSARLRCLGRPRPACAVGRGEGGWHPPLPAPPHTQHTHPETSWAVRRTAASCCKPNLPPQHKPPHTGRSQLATQHRTSAEGLQPLQPPRSDPTGSDPRTWTLGLPGWGWEPAKAIPNSPNLLQREGRNMGGESRWGRGMWPAQHGQDPKRPGRGGKSSSQMFGGGTPSSRRGPAPPPWQICTRPSGQIKVTPRHWSHCVKSADHHQALPGQELAPTKSPGLGQGAIQAKPMSLVKELPQLTKGGGYTF